MDMKEIGSTIRKYRKLRGLTQEQLAVKVSMATMSIRRYESGERIASEEKLLRIANALGVRIEDLHGGLESFESGEDFDRRWNEIISKSGDNLHAPYGANGLESVTHGYSKKERINAAFDKLTPEGQDKALERVEELAEIPKYLK